MDSPLQSYEKFDGIGSHAETVETRARIGEAFLEAYASVLTEPDFAGWSPADCPSELVGEMLDRIRQFTIVVNDDTRRRVAVALAKAHGLDFDEECGGDDCNSPTCIAAQFEDHDSEMARDVYLIDATTALIASGAQEAA